MPPGAERGRRRELASPADRVGGERVEQDPPEASPGHLGPAARAVIGLIEQDVAVLVEDPRRLAPGVDDPEELIVEPGRLERDLPVILVDVEHPALGAGAG